MKNNLMTFIGFFVGFMLSVIDISMFNILKDIISSLPTIFFWLTYILCMIFVILTARILIKNIDKATIKSITTFNFFKVLLLGYYIGFLVSLSNVYVVLAFNKIQGV